MAALALAAVVMAAVTLTALAVCVSMDNPFCYLNIIQLSNHPTIQPKFEFLSWNFLYSFSEVIEI